MDHSTREQELLSLLRREMNGAVAHSMREKGLSYALNYGVSLVDIKRVARSFAPDHLFARHLYPSGVRELRLAALYIADPEQISIDELPFWADGITTTEIASVGALALFSKSPRCGDIVFQWFGADRPLLQYAALMTAAANLMHTRGSAAWDIARLLSLVEADRTADPAKWTGPLEDARRALMDRLG